MQYLVSMRRLRLSVLFFFLSLQLNFYTFFSGHDGFPKIKEPSKKKTKADQIPQIEEYILEVVNDSERNDLKLTVADLKNKAIQFAKENGSPTFNPSKGWILRFLQRHGKKLPDKNGRTKGDEIRTRNQFSLAEKHEVAKYIVENQNVLAKDVAMIFTEKFAKPLTADTVRRIKSEGTASAYMTLIKSHFMFGGCRALIKKVIWGINLRKFHNTYGHPLCGNMATVIGAIQLCFFAPEIRLS